MKEPTPEQYVINKLDARKLKATIIYEHRKCLIEIQRLRDQLIELKNLQSNLEIKGYPTGSLTIEQIKTIEGRQKEVEYQRFLLERIIRASYKSILPFRRTVRQVRKS